MADDRNWPSGVTRRDVLERGAAGMAGVGLLGLAACGGDDDNGASATQKAAAPKAKKGGILRVGLVSGGPTSGIDVTYAPNASANAARWLNAFSQLAKNNAQSEFELVAAEEITP